MGKTLNLAPFSIFCERFTWQEPYPPFIPLVRVLFASVTLAGSRISVASSAVSLQPLQQPEEEGEEEPRSRPGTLPRVRRRKRRSGRLLTSNLRNCFAGSARPVVEAPTARNTGRWVCFLLALSALVGRLILRRLRNVGVGKRRYIRLHVVSKAYHST